MSVCQTQHRAPHKPSPEKERGKTAKVDHPLDIQYQYPKRSSVIYLFLMIIFLHLILADSALLDGRWFIYLCFPSLWASPSVLMLGLPTTDSSYSVVQWVRDSVNVYNLNQDRTGIINSSCFLCPNSHPFLPPSFFPSFSFFIRNSSVILVWVFKSCTWSWDILIYFMCFIFHVHR